MRATQDVGGSEEGLTRREFVVASAAVGAVGLPLFSAAAAVAPPTPHSVDLLVVGPDSVTFDDRETVIMDGAIAVNGNVIVWMGKAGDAASLFTAKDTVKASGQIAMPGMTDTHYHTAQQFLRGAKAYCVATLLDPLIPNDVASGRPQLVLCQSVGKTACSVDGGTGVLAANVGDPLPPYCDEVLSGELACPHIVRPDIRHLGSGKVSVDKQTWHFAIRHFRRAAQSRPA